MRSNGVKKWRGFEKFQVQTDEKWERERETGDYRAEIVVEPGKGAEATWEKQRLQERQLEAVGDGVVENICPWPTFDYREL